jgi:hypothetical protein
MFAIANFSRLIILRFRLNVRQRATKGNNLSLRDVSVLPEILEPVRCHFGVSNRVHDVFVAHVVLEGSRIVPIVGELVTSWVPKHVRMNWEWKPCGFSSSGDRFQDSGSGGGTTALGDKHVSRFCILPAQLAQCPDFLAAQRMNVVPAPSRIAGQYLFAEP